MTVPDLTAYRAFLETRETMAKVVAFTHDAWTSATDDQKPAVLALKEHAVQVFKGIVYPS